MLHVKYLEGFWMRLSSPWVDYADHIAHCKLSGNIYVVSAVYLGPYQTSLMEFCGKNSSLVLTC